MRVKTLGAFSLALWVSAFFTAFALSSPAEEMMSLEFRLEDSPAPNRESEWTREAPSVTGAPFRIRTCSVNSDLLDRENVSVFASVRDFGSMDLLWEKRATNPTTPASVQKLVTAVLAKRTLGSDFHFSTQIRQSDNHTIWVVGGGDPTLSRLPNNSYYTDAPQVRNLVYGALSAMSIESGETLTVRIDDSRYSNFSEWEPSWRERAWTLGYVAPVTSLQLDGDRVSPAIRLSPRSNDPSGRAASWILEEFQRQAPTAHFVLGPPGHTPVASRLLAEVRSAPLETLLGQMILDSDNSLAEALAREITIATGDGSIDEAYRAGLSSASLASSVFIDGSGLSNLNEISPDEIVGLLFEIAHSSELNGIFDSLPQGAKTGTLRSRFIEFSSANGPKIRAKTGSLEGTLSLAGFAQKEEAIDLVFAVFIQVDKNADGLRNELDALIAEIAKCGSNLSSVEPPPIGSR